MELKVLRRLQRGKLNEKQKIVKIRDKKKKWTLNLKLECIEWKMLNRKVKMLNLTQYNAKMTIVKTYFYIA
jgi:hypothetical protein